MPKWPLEDARRVVSRDLDAPRITYASLMMVATLEDGRKVYEREYHKTYKRKDHQKHLAYMKAWRLARKGNGNESTSI